MKKIGVISSEHFVEIILTINQVSFIIFINLKTSLDNKNLYISVR